MILECVLLSASLCSAVRDKPVLALTAVAGTAIVLDGVTTRSTGMREIDPISRALIGTRPTWARMAPTGAALEIGQLWLAERMLRSGNRWLRRLWWLPETIQIAGNIWGIADNELQLRHRRRL